MNERILVVDDEETMRRSLADILRLEGYQVQAVSNGSAALEILQHSSFDLMILDLKMPGMDGLEVMRSASQAAPETLIIMLTAHGSLESSIEALRHEAFDYLLKPSSPEQILKSVQGALARRNETRHKQDLLDELETSLWKLKQASRREPERGSADKNLVPLADDVTIDFSRREVAGGDQKVILTPTEGKMMGVFLENRGRVLSHRELVSLVQGYEISDWEAPEILRPLISRLRRKLARFPGGESWISSVRGSGYVLNL